MNRTRKGNYEVGYGKPPLHTRFQPGTSGNPNGRRRPTRTPEEILADALNRRVPVRENGRTRKITKHELIAAQLVNKAAAGDLKAVDKVMRLIQSPSSAKNAVAKSKEMSSREAHLQALIDLTNRGKEMAEQRIAEQLAIEALDAEQRELNEIVEEEHAAFEIDSYRMDD